MTYSFKTVIFVALWSVSVLLGTPNAASAAGGVEIGILTCTAVPGTRTNLLIRSTVDVDCVFKGSDIENYYKGETGVAFGLDLSVRSNETFSFTVLAATQDVSAAGYALTGKYVGASASVSAGVGLGAAVLVGGGAKSFSLQPLVLETNEGFGVSGGLAYLYIEPAAR